MRRRGARAFTLVELLIVLVVVAILAAVAVPAYGEYVRHANREAAKAVLAELLARNESVRQVTRTDASGFGPTGLRLSPDDTALIMFLRRGGVLVESPTLPDVVYSIALRADAALCGPDAPRALVATTMNGQVDDRRCATLAMCLSGRRLALDAEGRRSAAIQGSCWG